MDENWSVENSSNIDLIVIRPDSLKNDCIDEEINCKIFPRLNCNFAITILKFPLHANDKYYTRTPSQSPRHSTSQSPTNSNRKTARNTERRSSHDPDRRLSEVSASRSSVNVLGKLPITRRARRSAPSSRSVEVSRGAQRPRLLAKTGFVTSYAGSRITSVARQAPDSLQVGTDPPRLGSPPADAGDGRPPQPMADSPRFGGSPPGGSAVGDMDDDSAIGRGSASPAPSFKADDTSPSVSMSDQEESFECFGEATKSDTGKSSHHCRSQSQGEVQLSRRTWLRTSLRRTRDNASELPAQFRRYVSMRQSNKRPGPPNGFSSPVYRTPSFNSSGRSSNCDGEDMYSDISLEDDVNDLNHKVQVLERQVTVLADNQNNTDDRYTRSKQENAGLQTRLIMMEEQLHEVEMRSEAQLDSEKRRHKELTQRLEREKSLEVENHQIKSMSMEKELRFAEADAERCRQQMAAVVAERSTLDERLDELRLALETAQEETRRAAELERRGRQEMEHERMSQAQLVGELSRELAETRRSASLRLKTESDESGRIRLEHSELETELRRLRQQNKDLQESNEELQAQLLTTGLQEGMQLLDSGAKSLAAELENMSSDQVQSAEDSQKLKRSLQEQQEVNKQLRIYIDGILLNIVENYPQLLEVKRKR